MRRIAIALLVTSIAVGTDAIAARSAPAAPSAPAAAAAPAADPGPTTIPPSSEARPEEPAPSPESPTDAARAEIRCVTALQLFSSVEDAWFRSDSDRLASLVDTSSVHIAVKPGATPTAAVTRTAAAFLFQDQLRLVRTQAFQVTRVSVGRASGTAVARWIADWGGRQGVRTVDVALLATLTSGRWLLTEVRAKD